MEQIIINILSSSRRPSFSGTESASWASVNKSFGAYAKAYARSTGGDKVPSSVADATAGMKKWIASKTLLGDPGASTNRDLIFFPVVNPGTGKLNEGALRAVISGRGSQANIPAAALNSAQDMARKLLKSEFGVDIKQNVELTTNGKQLGIALSGALDVFTQESGETDLLDRLAVAVGTDDATMQAIVAGELDFIPRRWINIFAAILDIDSYELYMACSNDNSYARYYSDTEIATNAQTISGNSNGDPQASMAMLHNEGEASGESTAGTGNHAACEPCQKSLKEKMQEAVRGVLTTMGITVRSSEERDMDKKAKVEALIASERTQFNASHTDWLMTLSDEQLSFLEPKVAVETSTTVTQAAQTTTQAVVSVEPKPMTKEQILQTLGISDEALVAAQAVITDRKAARERCIAEITANAQCPYAKADLEAMNDAMLEKTHRMFDASPFRIAVSGRSMVANDAIPPTPPIALAAPGTRGVDFAVQNYKGAV